MKNLGLIVCYIFGVAVTGPTSAQCAAADEAAFGKIVAPILQRRCLSCHNPHDRKGDLSLATWKAIKESGVVKPGDPNSSSLLEMIASQNGKKPAMPQNADPLSKAEVAVLRNWIAAGAKWPRGFVLRPAEVTDANWWSFLPLKKPKVPAPEGAEADWIRTPIDAFILQKLREKGLAASPEADRRTLIRRLYYDLIGLPPQPKEVAAFIADKDPKAYQKLVEGLLASPRYGERWARHWLDVVHYGDTHGYDKDKLRSNAWPYRDYVIRALNDDTPYGRFVKEQLAGDVLYPEQSHLIAATGFIAAGPWDYVGHVEVPATKIDGRIARNLDRDDMVVNTIQTFCSVTVACARCHNHKFDPITQEDYYSLQAVFAAVGRNDRPFDLNPETGRRRYKLVAQKKSLQEEIQRILQRIDDKAGGAVKELDRQILGLSERIAKLQQGKKRSPRYGYHSQVAGCQDAVKWVQVDLGRSVKIDRLLIAGADEYGWADFGFPLRYKVEASADPAFKSSTTLADETLVDIARPGALPVEIDGRNTKARFIRITGTKLWNRRVHGKPLTNDWIFAIGELAVISGGKNVAEMATVTALDSIEARPRWAKANLTDGVFGKYPGKHWLEANLAEAPKKLAQLRNLRKKIITRLASKELAALDIVQKKFSHIAKRIAALPKSQMVFAAATHFKPQGGHRPSNGKPLPIYVLKRGMIDQHLKQVEPAALRFLSDLPGRFALAKNHAEGDRRAALARWIADERNPLTWRSIVNRVWQYHFGRGIVASSNDFGRMGAKPTHPKLLDWLAAEFRSGGQWIPRPQSLKALHRLIVTSSVYRQGATHNEKFAEIDQGNQYLWRFERRRLEAEAIRDTVLLVAGKLNPKMYGPGFRNFVLEQTAHSPQFVYEKHDPDDPSSHRRSVYRFLPRSQPQPFMQTLDCADPSQQVAKRDETITALSALALLNNKFMVRMAEHFAARLEKDHKDRGLQIDAAFQLALSRSPTDEERRTLSEYTKKHGLPSACRVILNLNEFVFID